MQINVIVIEGLEDTDANVTIISSESWHPNWPIQDVNVQFLVNRTLSQVKQNMRCVECIGPKEQRGILKPYVVNVAMNLWRCDLLQRWNTQINIPPILETNHKSTYVSGENITILQNIVKNSH